MRTTTQSIGGSVDGDVCTPAWEATFAARLRAGWPELLRRGARRDLAVDRAMVHLFVRRQNRSIPVPDYNRMSRSSPSDGSLPPRTEGRVAAGAMLNGRSLAAPPIRASLSALRRKRYLSLDLTESHCIICSHWDWLSLGLALTGTGSD